MPRRAARPTATASSTISEETESTRLPALTEYKPPQSRGGCSVMKLWPWVVGLGVILCLIGFHSYCESKIYLSNSEEIASIAKGFDIPADGVLEEHIAQEIAAELRKRFPGHVLADKDLHWIFFNVRGWIGAICVLHASLTEYILLFHTGIDTPGRLGRYWANVSDTVLTGSVRQWKVGQHKNQVFYAGDTMFHGYGELAAEQFDAGTWMVEYGRGFMPSTLGFALADTIFSTTEFATVLKVYFVMLRCLWNEIFTMNMPYYFYSKYTYASAYVHEYLQS